MKFNFEDYKGKYVMHCKTEEEAIDFCKTMHNNGMKWVGRQSYLYNNEWDVLRENTCYNFNNDSYSPVSYYKNNGYVILEWSDFMSDKSKYLLTINDDNSENDEVILGFFNSLQGIEKYIEQQIQSNPYQTLKLSIKKIECLE